MNTLALLLLLATAWAAQTAVLPAVASVDVPQVEDKQQINNSKQEDDLSSTLDVATLTPERQTGNSPSDVAENIVEHLDSVNTGSSSYFTTGYPGVSVTESKSDLLSRVKRARAVQRNHRHKKRRYLMGGKYRPHGKYTG